MINETAKKYVYLCSWFQVKEADKTITVEQFESVLNEIGRLETDLVKCGLSNKAIQHLIDLSKKVNLALKPMSALSQQELSSINEICSDYHHSVNTT